MTLEETAFEMFKTVHDRLGHHDDMEDYFNRPFVKQMWLEVARLVNDIVTRTWGVDSPKDLSSAADADAYEMFHIVHRRLEDSCATLSRESFALAQPQPRRLAWLEIADEVRAQARRRRAAWEEA